MFGIGILVFFLCDVMIVAFLGNICRSVNVHRHVLLYVLCFQRQSFRFFTLINCS